MKMYDKAENLPNETEHRLSTDEIHESANAKRCEFKLMLDYEIFIIFSRISMDKLCTIMVLPHKIIYLVVTLC
jgi:hypothetical protein